MTSGVDADGDWLAENQRLRMLTERALMHGDFDATREIERTLEPHILKLALSVPPEYRTDVAANLGSMAFEVLHRKFDQADLLLAYVIGALRRGFCDELKRITKLRRERDLPAGFDPPDLSDDADPASQLIAADADRRCRELIHGLKKRAAARGSNTDSMVATVIEVRYHLTHLTVVDACRTLGYTKTETATVSQKISRERANPNSALSEIARMLTDAKSTESGGCL